MQRGRKRRHSTPTTTGAVVAWLLFAWCNVPCAVSSSAFNNILTKSYTTTESVRRALGTTTSSATSAPSGAGTPAPVSVDYGILAPIHTGASGAGTVPAADLVCFYGMRKADVGGNEAIGSASFPVLLNYMSGGRFKAAFRFLQPQAQAIFTSNSQNSRLLVTGVQSNPIPRADFKLLNALCNNIWTMIQQQTGVVRPTVIQTTPPQAGLATGTPTSAAVGAPTASITSTSVGTIAPTTASSSRGPSHAFSLLCTSGMIIADVNRDDHLDAAEFMRFLNRLVSNAFISKTLNQVDPVFQTLFTSLAGGSNQIDVTGSKPGETPTASQTANLHKICSQADSAIQQYQTNANSSTTTTTSSPTAAPAAQTQAPMDQFLTKCRSTLFITDTNRDNILEQSEYVRFIDRLLGLGFTSFSGMDAVFQTSFSTLSNGNTAGFDVTGARPGTSTTDQEKNILAICTETQRVIAQYSGNSTQSVPASSNDIAACVNAIVASDQNADGQLEPVEYVNVLNTITNNTLNGSSFDSLNNVFKVAFEHASGNSTNINFTSASNQTQVQGAQITFVCKTIYVAIFLYENPPSQLEAACMSFVNNASSSSATAGALSTVDYIALVQNMSGNKWNAQTLADLPFVVGDNYEWLRGTQINVDVASNATVTKACNRTATSLELALAVVEYGVSSNLDYCTVPLVMTDINYDNFLQETEYVDFVNQLAAKQWDGFTFPSLPKPLLDLFTANSYQTTNSINIEGFRPDANRTQAQSDALSSFCNATQNAIVTERQASLDIYGNCKAALSMADANADNRLSQDEYVVFLYRLVGKDPPNVSFDSLSQILQINFNLIRNRAVEADISGCRTNGTLSPSQLQEIAFICDNTATVLPNVGSTNTASSESPNEVTIYNAFSITNTVNIDASSLVGGANRKGLDDAYTAFAGGLNVTSRLRNRRRLKVTGLKTGSPSIYRIDNMKCPSTVKTGSCQVAYASYILLIETGDDKESIRTANEKISQDAIDAGDLQTKLSAIDPQNQLHVVGSTTPIQPPAVTGASPPSSSINVSNKGSNLIVMLAVALGGAVVLSCMFVGFYIWYDRKLRRVGGLEKVEKQDKRDEQDGSADMDSCYDPEMAADENREQYEHKGESASDLEDSGLGSGSFNRRSSRTDSTAIKNHRVSFQAQDVSENLSGDPLNDKKKETDMLSALNSSSGNVVVDDDEFSGFHSATASHSMDASINSTIISKESIRSKQQFSEANDLFADPPRDKDLSGAPKSANEMDEAFGDGTPFGEDNISGYFDEPDCLNPTASSPYEYNHGDTHTDHSFRSDNFGTEGEANALSLASKTSDNGSLSKSLNLSKTNNLNSSQADLQASRSSFRSNMSVSESNRRSSKSNSNRSVSSSHGSKQNLDNAFDPDGSIHLQRFRSDDELATSPAQVKSTEVAEDDFSINVTSVDGKTSVVEEDGTLAETIDSELTKVEPEVVSTDADVEEIEEELEESDEESSSDEESVSDQESVEESDESASSDGDDATGQSGINKDTKYMAIRARIVELVERVVPAELENVDIMMEQFAGREVELITTLENMADMEESSGNDESGDEEESDDDEVDSDEDEDESVGYEEESVEEEIVDEESVGYEEESVDEERVDDDNDEYSDKEYSSGEYSDESDE
jgi:hypothetical protein